MRMTNDYISIGCDPELFAKRMGKFVSVHEILPGTKTAPCKVPKGAVQVDGVAAEFNIEPSRTMDDFVSNIHTVLHYMREIINGNAQGVELVAEPTATFGQTYFDSLPYTVKQLGCEPDYSAYTGKANPKPETDKPFRTGSGHVHIQMLENHQFINDVTAEKHFNDCCHLVRDLDVSLYMASKFWDKDSKRMSLYGKPGAFRPKPYGLEYRVLSNAWLGSVSTMRYVYAAAKETTKRWIEKEEKALSSLLSPVVENDNGMDFNRFEAFLARNKMPVPSDFSIQAA